MFNRLCDTLSRWIAHLENKKITLAQWFAVFIALAFLRNFLEGISAQQERVFSVTGLNFFFLHAPALYLLELLGAILVLRIITKERIQAISNGALFLIGPMILLPPLLDMLVAGGRGALMTYYHTQIFHSWGEAIRLFWDFLIYGPGGLLFFGSHPISIPWLKINYGIRIEVLLLLLIFTWYIFLKTKSSIKALVGFSLAYIGVFIIGTLPSITEALFGYAFRGPADPLHINHALGGLDNVLFGYLFIGNVACGAWWLYFYNKEKFFAVMKNLRFLRALAAVSALLGGVWLGMRHISSDFRLNGLDVLMITIACLSGLFRWFWVINENDLADEEEDQISVPHRPLASGALSRGDVKVMSGLFFGVATISSLALGYTYFLLGILMSCIAYLYSARPIRLKRFPILANMALAATYALVVVSGFLLVDQNSIFDFPAKIAILVLLVCSLGSEFKDIRDYEGDLHGSIKTLPVIFGLERGKKIIGILGACAFLLVPLFYPEYFSILVAPAIICAALYYYFINKDNYHEKPIFLLYTICAALFGAMAYFGIIIP